MADIEWSGQPEHASLRRAARNALRRSAPELRIVAENFLAQTSPIDLLAVGTEGELVSVRIARGIGEHEEALLLTRGLADISWLRPRVSDLAKIGPDLELEFSAEPRAVLLAPAFGPDVLSAAENWPARMLRLVEYRSLRMQGQLTLLLEPAKSAASHTEPIRSSAPPPKASAPLPYELDPSPRLTDPPSPSVFRTGLREADLKISPSIATKQS